MEKINLAEEFTRLHEAWNRAGVAEAPRARHAFAVFCHENAEVIAFSLGCLVYVGPVDFTFRTPRSPEELADLKKTLNVRSKLGLQSRTEFDIDAERIAFELWINSQSPLTGNIPRGEHGYNATIVQSAWLGWCERAKGKPL